MEGFILISRSHVYDKQTSRHRDEPFFLERNAGAGAHWRETFRTSPVARCLGQTAGGGRPGAAAPPRSRTVNAVAAVSPTDPAPPRSVPTRSARCTVGPPITTGHTPMRAEDPTARRKIPRVWDLTRAPLLSRSGEWAMTAIADQTRDELEKTPNIASGGRTQCRPTRLVDAQIHLQTRTNETKGEASRGAIGRALRHISKPAATRGVTNQETIGLRNRTLCYRMHMLR